MLACVIAFVAGLLALPYLPVEPDYGLAALGWGLAVGAGLLRLRWLGFALAGLAWGAGFAAWMLACQLPSELEGKSVIIQGRVIELPQVFPLGTRFDFVTDAVVAPPAARVPKRLRLSWYRSDISPKSGQHWQLEVRLKRPHGTFNPGTFDYERWLFFRGIRATGYVRESVDNRLLAGPGVLNPLAGWRQDLADRLAERLSGFRHGAIIQALTVGSRGDMSPQQWRLLRHTGTSHLVAISGLHIGLVAGLLFFIVRWLWPFTGLLRWSPIQVAALAAASSAFFYAALAGFSIPTRRALIMIAVVMGGLFLQRGLRAANVLAVALFGVVLYDPFAILSVGFWLSFAAVALIAFATRARLKPLGRWAGLLRIHAITALGLAPFLLFFFQQVPLLTPVANAVAVPLVSFLIVPLSLLGALLVYPLPWLAGGMFVLTDVLLEGLWRFLEFLEKLPFSQFSQGDLPLWNMVLALLGVVLWLAPRGVPCRLLAPVFFLPLVFVHYPRPASGGVWFTLLDVGQGLAAVVQTAGHVLVFDAGARYSDRYDLGEAVVVPFLRAQGIDTVDVMVISHGDNDHSGGADSVRAGMEVRALFASSPGPWADAIACRQGQSWRWDEVEFRMLAPEPDSALGKNDRSCVLQVVATSGRILLTGDIEAAAEESLTHAFGSQLFSEILVVPHHGSATSSSTAFLKAVQPRYALIPVGYRNRYGFPAEAVVERLREAGAEVASTAEAGAIRLKLLPHQGISMEPPFRESAGRFWNDRPR